MNIFIYDPPGPKQHEYLTKMFFGPLARYLKDHGIKVTVTDTVAYSKNSIVVLNADHLEPNAIKLLKDIGCKIVGFSCTDSSYVSQACRAGKDLQNIDLMFMLTGIQLVNEGHEMMVTPDYHIQLEKRKFLPDEDWAVFEQMRIAGRLQSLPYVHWERQPDVPAKPYNLRSQKALIRGGNHMRRFLLALALMKHDRLDINSGFFTAPYFADDMVPQFRYCERCREVFKKNHKYPNDFNTGVRPGCTNPHGETLNLSNLGEWNNRCPQSFYYAATKFWADSGAVEKLLNARWLTQQEHLEMLARITFTSDLKWLFSIYAPQRFWDAAMVGCINVLPDRTVDQIYFPVMEPSIHYCIYSEDFKLLDESFQIEEQHYNYVSKNARHLYDQWMKPTNYAINTNLLEHIVAQIRKHTA